MNEDDNHNDSGLLGFREDTPAAATASPRDSPFVRLLSEAEETCSTAEGAERLWQDKPRLAAVLEMLKRPASGSAYTQWAVSNELRKAAKVIVCNRRRQLLLC